MVEKRKDYVLFDENSQALVYGFQVNAVQRMLDFDFICKRAKPSVAAIIAPGQGVSHKFFYGTKEIMVPIYSDTVRAVSAHPHADVFINFASFRSAYSTSVEALNIKSIRTIVIIAEGVPERRARELIALAGKLGKHVIGPATVGGIAAGAFRIGNTAGTIENIVSSKLYRPGSVGFVSKSGGLSNELYNMLALATDGAREGIAVGGDAFPGSTLLDHILRFQENPEIKMIVALGEVGGEDEYEIVEALKQKKISKPLVMWVTGTCAKVFPTEVQFGHAGAKGEGGRKSADAKNSALKQAGAIVPNSFNDFNEKIRETFEKLRKEGKVKDLEEPGVPKIPKDYLKAVAEGLVRRPTNFVCTVSDDRGEEVAYNKVPLSKFFKDKKSLGSVIGHLWFKKDLPPFAVEFIEMALMVVADHGPAVSGAHNTIVASRAGKDLVSSLCSGLLTVGPRFGGAIDDAARCFKQACDSGAAPQAFIDSMKAKGLNIPGIGHRVKSATNPDLRVQILKDYAKKNFPKTKYLDYALEVEKQTLKKKNTLILNVDGCVAVTFLDLVSSLDIFTEEELNELVDIGYLNGLFVLGRSIGLIGHYFDQKRLKAGLYRHPTDDILYL
ncbi:ATP citrate synthase [Candidatus Micrarchaeota archaeon]|nr:ATP citrate synthase [Candidatus Micrarchaeota archaeon]